MVANDPIPSVSKKLVTAPIERCNQPGRSESPAGVECAAGSRRVARTSRAHAALKPTAVTERAASNTWIGVIGSSPYRYWPERRNPTRAPREPVTGFLLARRYLSGRFPRATIDCRQLRL